MARNRVEEQDCKTLLVFRSTEQGILCWISRLKEMNIIVQNHAFSVSAATTRFSPSRTVLTREAYS